MNRGLGSLANELAARARRRRECCIDQHTHRDGLCVVNVVNVELLVGVGDNLLEHATAVND